MAKYSDRELQDKSVEELQQIRNELQQQKTIVTNRVNPSRRTQPVPLIKKEILTNEFKNYDVDVPVEFTFTAYDGISDCNSSVECSIRIDLWSRCKATELLHGPSIPS